MDLTAERLRELLHYDPETGVFTWAVRRSRIRLGNVAGTIHNNGTSRDKVYRRIALDGRDYRAHNLAWLYVYGTWPAKKLDHRDGDGLHNAIKNLREATNSQNGGNSKLSKNNTSGFKGVHFRKDLGRWCAGIRAGGKSVNLGYFNSPEEAHEAYMAKAKEVFGEFARAA